MKTFVCLALIAGLTTPAQNYCAPTSTETAASILHTIAQGGYNEKLDYNGDGCLTVSDAINILRRTVYTLTGNEITVDMECINNITGNDCIYYEIDFVNGVPARAYELTVSEKTTANIYAEYADNTVKNYTIEVNPFNETVSVID